VSKRGEYGAPTKTSFLWGENPLFLISSPSLGKEINLIRCLRGAKPLLRNYLPLPLIKGKGIKGIGLLNQIKGGEVNKRFLPQLFAVSP